MPRTSINRAIRGEQGFQMGSGMTDPDTIAALGRQLGATYVVAGTITRLGNQ
ncbi:MAG: penicillin-binding protein activator LpoB, partial [Treponema sp.]|nr:penicillin-binding protein activator LpoB [Treponema sp.]